MGKASSSVTMSSNQAYTTTQILNSTRNIGVTSSENDPLGTKDMLQRTGVPLLKDSSPCGCVSSDPTGLHVLLIYSNSLQSAFHLEDLP